MSTYRERVLRCYSLTTATTERPVDIAAEADAALPGRGAGRVFHARQFARQRERRVRREVLRRVLQVITARQRHAARPGLAAR